MNASEMGPDVTASATGAQVADGSELFAEEPHATYESEAESPQAKVPPARDAKGKAQFADETDEPDDPGEPQAKVPPARDAKGKAQFADEPDDPGAPQAKVPPARDAKRKAQFADD
jgi:hypothetical protein